MTQYHKNINNLFIHWLFLSLVLVLTIILVGGLTRLTDSGLSITEWELFSGILPPLTESSWNNYFELYKRIPQYEVLNSDMTLAEFKYCKCNPTRNVNMSFRDIFWKRFPKQTCVSTARCFCAPELQHSKTAPWPECQSERL